MDAQSDFGKPNQAEVSTAEVLAEVKRRRVESQRPMGERRRQFIILADRFVFWLSKRWLVVFNLLAFLYVGLPILAPVLMYLGVGGPARVIYLVYRPLCNQLPQRSWFLFGKRFTYTLPELGRWVQDVAPPGLWAQSFVGNEVVGYKLALCQRCTAIYGAIFLFGLLFSLGRRRVRPLPWWAYIGLGLLPMAADGGYQFLSYVLPFLLPSLPILPHETTPLMRTVTGGLFGLATVWLAYPYVQEMMDEFRQDLQRRFGWE
jgi:uncharacterized membrane protein